MLVATWDALASSAISELYITKLARGGYGAIRDVNMEVPGRDGSWSFSERRGMRNIEAQATLLASSPTTLRATVVEVADWLDKVGRCKLSFSDQPDRYWMASLTSDINPDEWRLLGKFPIQWVAEPYSYANTVTEECEVITSGTDGDTFIASDAIEAYPEITIAPTGGNLTGVTFTLNDDTITWAGLIDSGGLLTISSISETILEGASGDTQLLGAFDVNDLTMAAATGDFPLVIPGSNVWTIDTDGTLTGATVCIKWRRRYR